MNSFLQRSHWLVSVVLTIFVVIAAWQPLASSPPDYDIMATRRPLVMVSGKVSQIPAGDTLAADDMSTGGTLSFTAGATAPAILTFAGDPNGTVVADVGSLVIDTSGTGRLWINSTGAAVWVELASASTTTTAIQGQAYGWFGTGIDGSPTFDGAATILGLAPAVDAQNANCNTYTLTRDLYLDSPTISAGICLREAGFRVFVKTNLIIGGAGVQIHDRGANAIGIANGAARANGFFNTSSNGGAGGAACPANGGPGANCAQQAREVFAGAGGGGGSPNPGGTGGLCAIAQAQAATVGGISNIIAITRGRPDNAGNPWQGGAGGGGGGCDTANRGGGGGAGGGYVYVAARTITGAANLTIHADGGNGANAVVNGGGNSGGGGGGGGGIAALVYGYGTTPTLRVAGGTGGSPLGTGTAGIAGSTGQTHLYLVSGTP